MDYEEAKLYLDGNTDDKLKDGEKEVLGYGDKNFLKAKGGRSKNFIKGLQILAKYDDNIICGSDHDILYVAEYSDKITKKEIEELCRLGFHLDSEGECWAYFT